MNVGMKTTWVVEFDSPELTLISKGLTGTLKPGERKAAMELAKQLADMRAQKGGELVEVLNGAAARVNELAAQPAPEAT